ncbi:hypothetical protein GCM10027425_29980 [Alteromonas gracilis]
MTSVTPSATVDRVSSPLGAFLCPPGFSGPSGLRALAGEASMAGEAVRHWRDARLQRAERSTRPYVGPHSRAAQAPVLLVPGFMAGDWSLAGLARTLRHHGHRTYRADIVLNAGCTRASADRLERRLEAVVARREQPVTIVGHSLGGMLARGLAARRPDLVAGIVTMGSPVLAPAAVHRLLAWDADLLQRLSRAGWSGLMGPDCLHGPCARDSFEETGRPLAEHVGYVALFSRRDGVVDWRSCLDPAAQEHVEVTTSHCGMAFDPVVAQHVLRALDDFRTARQRRAHDGSAGSLRVVNT